MLKRWSDNETNIPNSFAFSIIIIMKKRFAPPKASDVRREKARIRREAEEAAAGRPKASNAI